MDVGMDLAIVMFVMVMDVDMNMDMKMNTDTDFKENFGNWIVPHSKSGIVPKSSLLGAGQLGFWEVGKGGTIG
jgi:hypothetical protein